MSLTKFTERPEVAARLKPFRVPPPRKINVPLLVPPRSAPPWRIGGAFDYLIRFEFSRRVPGAWNDHWVAESAASFAPLRLAALNDAASKFAGAHAEFDQKSLVQWVEYDPSLGFNNEHDSVTCLPTEERFEITIASKSIVSTFAVSPEMLFYLRRARAVTEAAREFLKGYCASKSPTERDRFDLAEHALRLAKLDLAVRATMVDPTFESTELEDAAELVALLTIVPFERLIDEQVMLLNPTFGDASRIVGGADADLIVGDMLVDFKTTKVAETDPRHLDQLLGYFLLACRATQAGEKIPTIRTAALYFARHAHLWTHDVSLWTQREDFAELATWFFEHAKEVFPKPKFKVKDKPGIAGSAGTRR